MFDVLADRRCHAYRRVGSAKIRASDRDWLQREEAHGGTRVTMTQDSTDRFAKHATGRSPHGDGSVENPPARKRSEQLRRAAAAVRRGAAAGLTGALVMSVSTNAEMRVRGRPRSDAPARTLARIFGISARGKRRKKQLALAGHVATSISIGAVGGGLRCAGVPPAAARGTLFGLALVPEVLIVPALGASPPPWRWSSADWAITVLHHGVYAITTSATYELVESRPQR